MNKTAIVSSRPHVKWGSLVVSVITILISLVFLTINFYGNTNLLANSDIIICILAAYGWIPGFLLLISGILVLIEDFIPSFKAYKSFKARRDYVIAVKSAIKESLLISYKVQTAQYERFLKENPKYRVN